MVGSRAAYGDDIQLAQMEEKPPKVERGMTMVSYGWLIAVAIISGCAGYFIAAMMIAAKEDDDE